MRQAVASSDAPRPLGPYSPAIRAGNLLFISGQVPVDPATGTVVGTDIRAQTEQVMRNIGALLKSAGAGFEHVVRTTVFLADLNEFAEMNNCYAGFVTDPPPARATVQVARLPRDVKIEVDAIAVIPLVKGQRSKGKGKGQRPLKRARPVPPPARHPRP